MRGGYSVVADMLNAAYTFPDGREVSRQAVEAWHLGRVPNQSRQLPPSPVEYDPDAPRTQPKYIFDTDDWIEWARPGIRGDRGGGWIVPEPREGT